MTHLFLDCFSGISGDMFLAALADLGVDFDPLASLFSQAGVEVAVEAVRETANGISGVRVSVLPTHPQPVRTLQDVEHILQHLSVSAQVRSGAGTALRRLVHVESVIHGISPEDVHLHELGGVDTLVDVVGAFWGLEQLQADRVVCSPVPWFRGRISTAHGELPLPAPATLVLLEGKPVYPTEHAFEMVTPTGALLLDQCVHEFAQGPDGVVTAHGLGLGARPCASGVNGLRAVLFQPDCLARETVWILETNCDHLTGEEVGDVFDRMLSAGALDMAYFPAIMKKNRPGGMLQVLCAPKDRLRLETLLFRVTATLGIRSQRMARTILPRFVRAMGTPFGPVEAKETILNGQRFARPEFEALRKAADKAGLTPVQARLLLSRLEPLAEPSAEDEKEPDARSSSEG